MLATDETIGEADVRALLPSSKRSEAAGEIGAYASLPYMEAKRQAVADFTSTYLKAKLAMHGGQITKAAEDSKIPRQHFSLLMKRHLNRSEPGNS